jgi:hypothetical protein
VEAAIRRFLLRQSIGMDPSRKRAIRLTVALTAALLLATALIYVSFDSGRDEFTVTDQNGRFVGQQNSLTTKCPSKYQAASGAAVS